MNAPLRWPNNARTAVLVSVLLETWADGRSPTYFPRTTPLKAGARDVAGIQWSEYGGKEGVWRLMRIIERNQIRATGFCNGLSAERYPEAVSQLVRSGHDIAAHGYAQSEYLYEMDPPRQRQAIQQTLDALEKASGKRPTGWLTPVYGGDAGTPDLLAEAGIQWHCDILDSSSPRIDARPNGTMVGIPWSEFVDNRVLRSSPRDYFDVYKGMFDFLHKEEPMGMMHIGIHSHFGGRPLVAAVFHEILQYLRGFDDVWFPTCGELADWARNQDPAALSYKARFFHP
jgi:peptidoglycan/xylan/chitin deacetylase (PgdA/CDA1 family)